MTKAEKLNTLKTLLVDHGNNNWEYIKRKEIIAAAVSNGLVEKDTYVALKGSAKSSTIGYYVVAEMLTLVEAAMNKGAPAKKAKAKKAIKKVAVKRSIEQEIAEEVRGTEDEIGDVSCFSEFENSYNEMALADELSIMGTSL
jgi:hypothetical protein|tara:strand:- start:12481 stop:12906 length:426 start_codon:yes stop_codon:yes gene_type:complete